ncbi:MAG: EamA family transporter [Actinomycetota bacterium]
MSATDAGASGGETAAVAAEEGHKAMLIGLILVSVTLAALAQLTLKHGVNVAFPPPATFKLDGASIRSMVSTPIVWVGVFLFACSAVAWVAVLSRTTLSFAYPFVSLTYVFILVADRFFLHEAVPGLRWAGVAFIVAGIILISRTPHNA